MNASKVIENAQAALKRAEDAAGASRRAADRIHTIVGVMKDVEASARVSLLEAQAWEAVAKAESAAATASIALAGAEAMMALQATFKDEP